MSDRTSTTWCLFLAIVLHSFTRGFRIIGFQFDNKTVSSSHPNSTDALYSPWSMWSHCSHTCNTGISMRSRTCQKRSSNENLDDFACLGEAVEHKICKIQNCPPGTPDFRDSQCSRYNNRFVGGQRAKHWIPTNGGTNPCELRCEAEGVVSGFGKVEDGTPCRTGVCIDGRCAKVGCDDRLGSGTEFDMCGICGGRNATCVHYKDEFFGQATNTASHERRNGYQEVVVLPAGSRNLEIRQKIGDNILAIRDRNTAILYHGDDRQDQVKKQIAGTILTYTKEDLNRTEVLKATGPLTMELYVLVLMRERNLGISYQYWLPTEQQFAPRFRLTPPLSSGNEVPTHMSTSANTWTTPKPIAWTSHYLENRKHFHHKATETTTGHFQAAYKILSPLNYGPKRKGLFYAKFNSIHSIPQDKHFEHLTVTDNTYNWTPSKPVFIPRHNINYRTRKPTFDYYAKYRNISNYPTVIERTQQQIQAPPLPLGDSSAFGDEERRKNSYNKIEHEKNDVKSKKKFVNFPQIENPSPKWKYKYNGKRKDENDDEVTTPVSISVLVLPEKRNYTKTRRGKRRGFKNQPTRPPNQGPCPPCMRVRDQTKHFCSSDFVIRAIVLGYEYLHGETRYELEVIQSFKNTFSLLSKEYIWSPDTCRCPKLRIGKEYIIMGHSDDNYRRNENRLLVDSNSFVRNYNSKFGRRLLKLKKEQSRKCSRKIS